MTASGRSSRRRSGRLAEIHALLGIAQPAGQLVRRRRAGIFGALPPRRDDRASARSEQAKHSHTSWSIRFGTTGSRLPDHGQACDEHADLLQERPRHLEPLAADDEPDDVQWRPQQDRDRRRQRDGAATQKRETDEERAKEIAMETATTPAPLGRIPRPWRRHAGSGWVRRRLHRPTADRTRSADGPVRRHRERTSTAARADPMKRNRRRELADHRRAPIASETAAG